MLPPHPLHAQPGIEEQFPKYISPHVSVIKMLSQATMQLTYIHLIIMFSQVKTQVTPH